MCKLGCTPSWITRVRKSPGVFLVTNLPVAGETRQVRLPHLAEWDERLAEIVRQAAGVPVEVELRAASVEVRPVRSLNGQQSN